MGHWKDRLISLNLVLEQRLRGLGTPAERRRLVVHECSGAAFVQLQRREPAAFRARLDGPVVGVDGSLNTFGGDPPHYVALIRAAAVPAGGTYDPMALEQVGLLQFDVWSPLAEGGEAGADAALQLRRRQTRLEAEVACAAIEHLKPSLLLIDGGLVRFYKEAIDSFRILAKKASENGILVAGIIENVESAAIQQQAEPAAWPGWGGVSDRALLWDVLSYGEVLKLGRPLELGEGEGGQGPAIRRWFMQSSQGGAAIGLDFLEDQAARYDLTWVAEYLFTLTPADGRGVPVWMDMVDRQVRITEEEIQTWVNTFLSVEVRRRLLASKRSQRPRF